MPKKGLFASVARLLGSAIGISASEQVRGCEKETFDPLIYPLWQGMVAPRRLWEVPGDPFVHFIRWTFEYRAYLPLLCGLAKDSAVLELGCSHGRTMLALIGYLEAPGRYEGFDIAAEK